MFCFTISYVQPVNDLSITEPRRRDGIPAEYLFHVEGRRGARQPTIPGEATLSAAATATAAAAAADHIMHVLCCC